MSDETSMGTPGVTTAYQSALATLPSGSDIKASVEDAAGEATRVVRDNAGLVIVGGLALGVLTAALWPRSKSRKLAKKSRKISSLATELGAALLSQASDKAGDTRDKLGSASRSVSGSIADQSQEISKQAQQLASSAADQLNDAGKAIARKAVKFIEKARG